MTVDEVVSAVPENRWPRTWLKHWLWPAGSVILFAYAVRLICKPYAGLVHDAKLYSLQVANRAFHGLYQQDLFFAYGSQDAFSIISWLFAPLAAGLGIEVTFVGAYLISMLVLVVAEYRLVRALVPGRLASGLAMLLLMVSDLPYAGLGVFQTHEPFFTARLPAQALVVFGLERLVRGRCVTSLFLMLVAMLIHPLMAVGGLAVSIGSLLTRTISVKTVVVSAGTLVTILGLVALRTPWLAHCESLTGEWEHVSRAVSPHCFVSEWGVRDVARILGDVAICIWACRGLTAAGRRLVVLVLVLTACSGAVSWIADVSGLALLVQGQAYRSLWLIRLIAVPLGVSLLRRGEGRDTWGLVPQVAVGLFLLFHASAVIPDGWIVAFVAGIWLAVACPACFHRRTAATRPNSNPDGVTRWTVAIVSAVALSWSILEIASVGPFLWRVVPDIPSMLLVFPRIVPVPLLLLGVAGVVWVFRNAYGVRSVPLGLALAAMAINVATMELVRTQVLRGTYPSSRAAVRFVQECLPRSAGQGPPQVYWPLQSLAIWHELHARCYYDYSQISGVIFQPRTALEAHRRSQLVAPFETTAMRRLSDYQGVWQRQLTFMAGQPWHHTATADDLIRLVHDTELDWVVLPFQIPALPYLGNGEVFVYDCRRLRELARSAISGGSDLSQKDGGGLGSRL